MLKAHSSLIWRTALSIAVSFFLLALFFRMVSASGHTINLARLVEALKNIPLSFFLFYVALRLISTLFRTERFRVLLHAGGATNLPGFSRLYLITMIRNMVVDLLPARLGELAYAGLLNRGYHVRIDVCMSSLSLSILFDLLVLAPVVFILALIPLTSDDLRTPMMVGASVVALATVVGVLALIPGSKLIARWLQKVAEFSDFSLINNFSKFVSDLSDAISRTLQWGVFGRCLLLTFAVRACKYFGLYTLFLAVTVPNFPAMIDITPLTVLTSLIASEASASLPVPTFMAFGTYELGGSAALIALGYPAVESTMTILSLHIASQLVDYVLGGICLGLFLLLLPRKQTAATSRGSPSRRWIPITVVLTLLLGVGLAGAQYKKYRKVRSLVPPPTGEVAENNGGLQQQSIAALQQIQLGNGFLVWSSNRFGNHDILKMTLPDLKISRLTRHPNSEYFPRISPDGKHVVFARGRKKWVSQRNTKDWDVYVLNLNTGIEKLVATNANHPSWSADGKNIIYQYKTGGVMRQNFATGEQSIIVQSGRPPMPGGLILHTPSFHSPSDRLAVTLRGAASGVIIMTPDASEYIDVGKGCQIFWSPDGNYAFWVGHGGLGTNKIYRYDPETQQKSDFLDMQGEYSHEYFPKLSANGDYMVLSASTGGHEHDVADYEVFLWPLNAGWDEAIRLTFHTGNDNWPDIYLSD